MQVRWNRSALLELEKSVAYCLQQFDEQTAADFYARIMEYAEALSSNPNLGKEEPLLAHYRLGFRSLVAHRYFKLIYYIRGETVHIADIWDVRREPQALARRIKSKN